MIMPWSMRPGGASDRMLQTAQEIGREECTVYTGMTGGAGKWNLDHVLPGGSIDVSSVHSFDQLHLALQLKLQEISKCLMFWVLRLRGKETQWYQRAWFFNQATNMPWHNKEQKRCSLRNSLDVSRTPKEKRDEDGKSYLKKQHSTLECKKDWFFFLNIPTTKLINKNTKH